MKYTTDPGGESNVKAAGLQRYFRPVKTKRVTQIGGLYRCSQLTLSGCQLAPDMASFVRSECGPLEVSRFVQTCPINRHIRGADSTFDQSGEARLA